MSSFGGHMREYVDVSLDRFDGENLESTVYFLSHKHEDHMMGLSSPNFVYRLQSNSHIKLYCSDVTRDLLLADDRFTGLAKSMVVQELEVPCSIPVPDPTTGKVKYHVTVTLIPAGHCPGSVMVLFEGAEGTALYTGDFRLARGDIPRVECLKSGNSPKPIDSLYIDTTFCVPEAYYIPSREDCTEAIIKVVEEWTSISPNHMILIYHRAGLGYEHLFVELAQHFNTKIHLGIRKYDQCKRVKALPDFGTSDGISTQIHACKWEEVKKPHKSPLPCGRGAAGDGKSRLRVKKITVSTLWFTHHVGLDEIVVTPDKSNPKHLRACYSFHSSYSEVRDVVTYLNPRRVFPNVIPKDHTQKRIQDRLNNFLKLASVAKLPCTSSKPRPLGKQRPPHKRPHSHNNSQSTDSDLLFDDSPRKPKKQKLSKEDAGAEQGAKEEFSLTWDASQSTDEPGSQPHATTQSQNDVDIDSSYVGSQRSNTSAMDLVASDFDLTPKKQSKKDSQSTADSIECAESEKVAVNGYCGGLNDHSDELFSDGEEDAEVLSVRETFKPFKEGSYGSHVTYASDIDLTDSSDDDCEDEILEERKADENGDSKLHNSKCQNGQSTKGAEKPDSETKTEVKNKGIHSDSKSQEKNRMLSNGEEKSDNQEPLTEPLEKSAVKEANQSLQKEDVAKEGDEDEDDDVIMLDSDEEGEIAGEVPETMSEEEDSSTDEPEKSTTETKVTEVIDLTAEDDDDDDIVSMGIRRFHGEEGDGYHGDSESEENDTDGIMTDSDGSFAKASYEKTKTRMRNGRSRRARVINGYSSSDDSESDSDATVDESPSNERRFPIAGSCHYSSTRLNGFHSTLVDSEVIVLDDQDDEPPPNVTVVDIAEKDKQAEESKSNLASAEDLVSGAMEMASAATNAAKASSRLASTINCLKKTITKPVLSHTNAVASGMLKQTARKSTSVGKLSPRKCHEKEHDSEPEAEESAEVEEKNKEKNETCDTLTSPTTVDENKLKTSLSAQNDCLNDVNDSGTINDVNSKQGTAVQETPSNGLLR